MLTIWIANIPLRVETSVMVPIIARQIERLGQLDRAAREAPGAQRGFRERSQRIALKTALGVYLDMVENDLDEQGSGYPRPRCPKGADYITWAVQYIAGYFAHMADGATVHLVVDDDAAGGIRVTDVEFSGLAGLDAAIPAGSEPRALPAPAAASR